MKNTELGYGFKLYIHILGQIPFAYRRCGVEVGHSLESCFTNLLSSDIHKCKFCLCSGKAVGRTAAEEAEEDSDVVAGGC